MSVSLIIRKFPYSFHLDLLVFFGQYVASETPRIDRCKIYSKFKKQIYSITSKTIKLTKLEPL